MVLTWNRSQVEFVGFVHRLETESIIFVNLSVFHFNKFLLEIDRTEVSGVYRIDDCIVLELGKLDSIKRGESFLVLIVLIMLLLIVDVRKIAGVLHIFLIIMLIEHIVPVVSRS